MVSTCLGRVVDILEASGAFDPGSNPGRGVQIFPSKTGYLSFQPENYIDVYALWQNLR
jgi:hypothetical protein